MKWFIQYDATGKILGRLFVSEDSQADNQPNHLLEITQKQHDSEPEKWSKGVDINKKKLKGVDPTEKEQ